MEEIQASIHAMLRQSSALPDCIPEEYAIHDYEGFAGYEVGEYESLETVVTVAAFVAEHGELGGKLLAHGHDVSGAKKAMEEQHAGCAESLGAWVAEYIEDTGELSEIPERWHPYIDFERYANDLLLGGEVFTIEVDGEVHVFWNR